MKKKPPIKLFADAHVFDKEYQGTRTFIKELYTLLAQKPGLQLYLGAFDTDNLKAIFPENDTISFLPYKSKSSFKRLGYDIPALIKQHGIDYAHFQYILPPLKKCRYIVTIHDVIFNDYPAEFSLRYRLLKNFLYKTAATKADIVTTVSEYSKESIRKYLQKDADNIHIIPNGVNEKYFAAYDKQAAVNRIHEKYGIGKSILYVSRFEPRKNHIGLLNAWLDLKLYEQGYHLVLLGHKTLRSSAFDERLASLPDTIKQFVFISNSITDDELLEFYRAASVFVYPSKAEGFGISPLEAAALKIPVICSNASAMSEFSFFGETHIDCADTALLTRTLSNSITHPPGKEDLQRIAGIIHNNYSWEHPAEEFYRLLLQDHSSLSAFKQKENDKSRVS